jgi:hypothetical protein
MGMGAWGIPLDWGIGFWAKAEEIAAAEASTVTTAARKSVRGIELPSLGAKVGRADEDPPRFSGP